MLGDASVLVAQAVDLAGAEVAVDVGAAQPGDGVAAVDVAADDGAGCAVEGVLPDGRDGALAVAVVAGTEAVVALEDVPAVVAAPLDDVDLLPLVLADVAGPQLAGLAVEGETPGVAEAVSPDLGAAATVSKRVVRRDGVRLRGRCVGDLYPQDGAEEGRGVLSAAQGVAGGTAVAEADVEVSVGAKGDLPAVVVRVGLLDLDDDQLGVRIGLSVQRIVVEAGNDGAAGVRCRVVDVQVAFVGRVHSQAQQALFGAAAADAVAKVERLHNKDVPSGQVPLPEVPDPSCLLRYQDLAAAAEDHVCRSLCIVGREYPLQAQRFQPGCV